jgi:hypothetical protein
MTHKVGFGTKLVRCEFCGRWSLVRQFFSPQCRKGQGKLMTDRRIAMEHDKKIALVAHDNKKRDLLEWAKYNRDLLAHHEVYATGTTGEILERELGFRITKLQSWP